MSVKMKNTQQLINDLEDIIFIINNYSDIIEKNNEAVDKAISNIHEARNIFLSFI